MTTQNSTVRLMDILRAHILEVVGGKTSFDESSLAGLTPAAMCDVLRSIPRPFVTRSLNTLFLKLLEMDQQAFVSVLRQVFTKTAFNDIRNVVHFLSLTSGPGFVALQSTPQLFKVLSLFIDLTASQQQQTKRYVFNDEIPEKELPILRKYELLKETEFADLSCFSIAESREMYRFLGKHIHYDAFPNGTIGSSTSLPDDIFPKVVALISQWFANSKGNKEDGGTKQPQPNALDYHTASSLAKTFYIRFRQKYETSKSPTDLEFLHHIIWLTLTFLGKDADTGIFRPYAEIDSQNSEMLIDYLLLDPHEHLLLFLMHNRDAQYSSLSKYGMGFDGTESSGSGTSSCGLTKTFNDVPIAEYLLEPALAKLSQNQDPHSFWSMLKKDWVRPNAPTTSLHPTVLRRATVPSLIKLARTGTPRLRREVQTAVAILVASPEGIPNTSDKVFSEISKEQAMFSGSWRNFVFRLITIDIERSIYKIPTNYFAYECLLKLIASGYKKAEPVLAQLILNIEFQKRDTFDFDILANIERFCGKDSPLLKKAVKTYQGSTEWKKRVSHYSEETAQRVISENVPTTALSIDNIGIYSDSLDSNKGLQKQLTTLAENSFSDFVTAIRRIQGTRTLADAFCDRSFIVNVTEKQIHRLAQDAEDSDHAPATSQIIGLINDLAADPDPAQSDTHDKRVSAGENLGSITSIRTRVCYLICDALNIRPLILDLWNITKRLVSDKNSYVVYHAFNPFIEVLRRRNWNTTVKCESAILLWELFNTDKLPEHQKKLFQAFSYVRDLSENDAEKVILRFWSQEGVEKLLLFYGVYRKQYEADMGSFDAARFVSLLEKAIDEETSSLPLHILKAVTRVCYDDKKVASALMPYLLRYTKPSHARADIVQESRTIIGQLLDAPEHFQVMDIRQFILNTTKLEFELLHRKDDAARNAVIFPLEEDDLDKFFNLDREGFYAYVSLINENLSLCDRLPILDHEIFEVLLSESDPARCEQIMAFADNLVSHHPGFYAMRQVWLDQVIKRFAMTPAVQLVAAQVAARMTEKKEDQGC